MFIQAFIDRLAIVLARVFSSCYLRFVAGVCVCGGGGVEGAVGLKLEQPHLAGKRARARHEKLVWRLRLVLWLALNQYCHVDGSQAPAISATVL